VVRVTSAKSIPIQQVPGWVPPASCRTASTAREGSKPPPRLPGRLDRRP
jgi:hypothetical protein